MLIFKEIEKSRSKANFGRNMINLALTIWHKVKKEKKIESNDMSHSAHEENFLSLRVASWEYVTKIAQLFCIKLLDHDL